MKKVVYFIAVFSGCIHLSLYPQAVARFSAPDTICQNIPFTISNQSTGVINNDYYWNFATGNLVDRPNSSLSVNLGVLDTNSNGGGPMRLSLAQDGNSYYLFYTAYGNGTANIIRVKFNGSYMDPNPVVDSITNTMLGGKYIYSDQGISIKYDSTVNKWFGFYVSNGGRPIGSGVNLVGEVYRLDFGNSLDNSPAVSIVDTNMMHISFGKGVEIVRDNAADKWYVFVGMEDHWFKGPKPWGFARYEFNHTLGDPNPVYTKIDETMLGAPPGQIGVLMNAPEATHTLRDKDGNWYTLVLNTGGSYFTRVFWGSSLSSNTPTGEKLAPLAGVASPYDFQLVADCDRFYAPIISGSSSNGLSVARFDSLNSTPVSFNFGNVAGFSSSNGISTTYRMGDTIVCFVGNAGNRTISRIVFVSDVNPDIPTPVPPNNPAPTITYRDTGTYQIRLAINGASNPSLQSSYCKMVKVISPPLPLPPDTAYCYNGSGITLVADRRFSNYTWLPDSTTGISFVTSSEAGSHQYRLRLDSTRSNGCIMRDTFNLTIYPNPSVSTTQPFYMQVVIHADSGNAPYEYAINNPPFRSDSVFRDLYPGTYQAMVRDSRGCVGSAEVVIQRIDIQVPNYFTPNGDGTNDLWYLRGIDNFPKAVIKIYDRYGVLLASYTGADFESRGGWDGFYEGKPMPSDDYWYYIDLKDGRKPYTGHVTLKR